MVMMLGRAAKGRPPGPWRCDYEDDALRQGSVTKESWYPYQGRHPRQRGPRWENSDLGGRYSLARHVLPQAPDVGTKTHDGMIVPEVPPADWV